MEQALLPAAPVQNSLALLSAISSSNNLILAFCLDGTVYALDESSGRVLWRVSEAFTNGPLLQQSVHSPGGLQFMLEPIDDGAIFTNSRTLSMQKLPFSLKEVVQNSPVRWEATEDSESKPLVLIGKRESSVFAIDLETGLMTCRGFSQSSADGEDGISSGRSLLLGRSDFHLQAFEAESLKSLWSLNWTQFKSVGEVEAELVDSPWSYYPSFEGFLVAKSAGRNPWMTQLSSPALQLFKPIKEKNGAVGLFELSLQSAKPANHLLHQHIQYDQSQKTFYFDDLVNVGVIGRTLFVLPQSRYMLIFPSAAPIDDNDSSASASSFGRYNSTSLANGVQLHSNQYKYLGVHRIVRHVPAEPVLTLDSPHEGNAFWLKAAGSGLFLLLSTLFTFLLLRRRKQSKSTSPPTSSSSSSLNVLQVFEEEVLGVGSHGTLVYRGEFDGRSVAVKRLLADFFDIADREISLLQQHDNHPNIIRYFYREKSEKFIYIALELANLTLAEWIESESATNSSDQSGQSASSATATLTAKIAPKQAPIAFASLSEAEKIDLFEQIMQGIAFLHSVHLVHRDLKPQNILIKFKSESGPVLQPQVLISDFGLSRRLVETESSFHATAASGTLGWRAPELIFNEESAAFQQSVTGPLKIGRSVDIFAAGLVLFYLLTGGEHAFGPKLLRESNIVGGRSQIKAAKLSEEAKDLLALMLAAEAKDRPSAAAVLKHPLFWSPARQLAFICAVSDALEGEERLAKAVTDSATASQDPSAPPGFVSPQPSLPMREAVNACAPSVFPSGQNCWHKVIDRVVFADLTRHRFYLVACVHDLLRVIRNKRNHFSETPASIQEILGSSPEAAWLYFRARFPRLLLEIYRVMRVFRHGNEVSNLDSFY